MAKKKENQLSYLQMPLPQGRKAYRMAKRVWGGMDYGQTIDSGALSMESNISTLEAPCLVPSQKMAAYGGRRYTNPISLAGFDDFLLVVYRDGSRILMDYLKHDAEEDKTARYTGVLKASGATSEDEYPRCIVPFNKYLESGDIVNGEYIKKLLIFPDKKSMDFEITDDFTLYDMDVIIKTYYNATAPYLPPESADHDYYYQNTYDCEDTLHGAAIYKWCQYETEDEDGKKDGGLAEGWKISVPPSFPDIKYAAVHLSRLFGVSDDSVYASGFNDYTNWNLDSIGGYNESNAWCSKAQSNTKADGNFTGITNFQGHIVCFKRDFMHEIYNTKNPFRIQDIYAEGAIDNRTIQDVDGKLIFVSEDAVKVYTGANPRIISQPLNISRLERAVSGTDGRCYYLFCEDKNGNYRLFTYDTYTDFWSEQYMGDAVLGFAHNKQGMFMLCEVGYVYKMDTEQYSHDWSFETDLITSNTVNIKHLKKIQMLVDIPAIAGAEVNDGARIDVYVLYGDENFNKATSHLVYSGSINDKEGRRAIRVKPRNKKNASYGIKLHIEGHGYVKIHELELFIENGGDLYV